jgi:ribosomal protein S27E
MSAPRISKASERRAARRHLRLIRCPSCNRLRLYLSSAKTGTVGCASCGWTGDALDLIARKRPAS